VFFLFYGIHLITKIGEYAIIVDEDKKKFLLVQWGKYYDFSWHFPGGRIDENEGEKEGLVRELKEEIGVEVEEVKPVYAKYIGKELMLKPKDEKRYALFYLCKLRLHPEKKIKVY
jgi:8-oxo-dGTP pyrophosphatase MutT (NUDIX family)